MESVVHVQTMSNYMLKVGFDTGETKLFNVEPYIDKGIFKILQDQEVFAQAYVDYGTVCWPGSLDIAPETLFDKGISLPNE